MEPTTNLTIQYCIVGLVLLAAVVWIVWKLVSMRKQGNISCSGCALADTCCNKNKKTKVKNGCSPDNKQTP